LCSLGGDTFGKVSVASVSDEREYCMLLLKGTWFAWQKGNHDCFTSPLLQNDQTVHQVHEHRRWLIVVSGILVKSWVWCMYTEHGYVGVFCK
jgi:hypothetical protein